MQSETPLTLPSPARGEGILYGARRRFYSPNGDRISSSGIFPLPLRERIKVRGLRFFNCIVERQSFEEGAHTQKLSTARLPSTPMLNRGPAFVGNTRTSTGRLTICPTSGNPDGAGSSENMSHAVTPRVCWT